MTTGRNKPAFVGKLFRSRRFAFDVAGIAAVPLVLVAVFLLPQSVLRSLAFETADPTLVTAYTSHFVHFRFEHLFGNLLGYCVIVSVTYALSTAAQYRRQFWAVFASLVTVFPFVLSLGNWLFLGPGIALGFSGVLLGFYGYLPLALYQYVATYAHGQASIQYSPFAFFLGTASISVVLSQPFRVSVLVTLLALLLAAMYLVVAAERTVMRGLGKLKRQGFMELAVCAGLLYVLYPLASFSAGAQGNVIVNLYVHLLGFALSFVIIYVMIVMDGRLDRVFPVDVP